MTSLATVKVLLLSVFLIVGCSHKPHYVTLTWQPPQPVSGVTIVSYNIYRSTRQGGPYVLLATSISSLTYDDHIVNRGQTYFYIVRSVDQHGRESKDSMEVTAVIP